MAWTNLSFAYGSTLTSTQMTQMFDNFAALAAGASGAPTVVGASVALVASGSMASVASVDITSGIDSTYDWYKLIIRKMQPATNGSYPFLYFSQDGGSTWITSVGAYRNCVRYEDSSAAASSRNSDERYIYLTDAQGVSNQDIGGVDIEINFVNPSSTTRRFEVVWRANGLYTSTSNYQMLVRGAAHLTTTGLVDAFRFVMNSGNISAGNYELYGFKK